MKICGVIPIRAGSKRFPEKGLALLKGKEIVLHVLDRCRQYRHFERLIVATDDVRIGEIAARHGGEVFYSQEEYRNGSERVADAVTNISCDICVDIQGDEVFITSEAIGQTVNQLHQDENIVVATAVFPIERDEDLHDTNLVKVLLDKQNRAIAFSRNPITSNGSTPTNYGHVGIYAYRREFLMRYPTLAQTKGELEESLEQLRILESGYKIGAVRLQQPIISINTPKDLIAANIILSTEGGVKL